jgi:hypothetical protein
MPSYSADFWATHAAWSREIAASMRDNDARKRMLSVAMRCEGLANIARQSELVEVVSAQISSVLRDRTEVASGAMPQEPCSTPLMK